MLGHGHKANPGVHDFTSVAPVVLEMIVVAAKHLETSYSAWILCISNDCIMVLFLLPLILHLPTIVLRDLFL